MTGPDMLQCGSLKARAKLIYVYQHKKLSSTTNCQLNNKQRRKETSNKYLTATCMPRLSQGPNMGCGVQLKRRNMGLFIAIIKTAR